MVSFLNRKSSAQRCMVHWSMSLKSCSASLRSILTSGSLRKAWNARPVSFVRPASDTASWLDICLAASISTPLGSAPEKIGWTRFLVMNAFVSTMACIGRFETWPWFGIFTFVTSSPNPRRAAMMFTPSSPEAFSATPRCCTINRSVSCRFSALSCFLNDIGVRWNFHTSGCLRYGPGRNSARCLSPAAGMAPYVSNKSNATRCAEQKTLSLQLSPPAHILIPHSARWIHGI